MYSFLKRCISLFEEKKSHKNLLLACNAIITYDVMKKLIENKSYDIKKYTVLQKLWRESLQNKEKLQVLSIAVAPYLDKIHIYLGDLSRNSDINAEEQYVEVKDYDLNVGTEVRI